MLIDTHAHLNFIQYQSDLDQVIAQALEAGVEKIVCPGSNLTDSARSLKLGRQFPNFILPAVGIHPQQTNPKNDQSVSQQIGLLEELISRQHPIAIGECGLDFAPVPPGEKERPSKDQEKLFFGQIKLAQKYRLPLLIHTRKSFPETVEILNQFKDLRGVFHCYSAGRKGMTAVDRLGFYYGFDGNLTYDEGLQKIASLVPSEKILLETDSPFLAPTPFRGQRNQPAYLIETARKLAEIKKVSLKEVSQTTTQNAKKLFEF